MNKESIVFLKYNGALLKLLVTYDASALEEIRKEIIRDCSVIRRVKDKREISYSLNDYQGDPRYQNVQRNVLKYPYNDESYDGSESTPGEQIVSYDYYEYPKIAYDLNTICKVGFGGKQGFGLRLEKEQEYKPFKDSLIESMNKIVVDPSLDIEERLNKLGELSELLRAVNRDEVVYPKRHVGSFNERILATMGIKLLGSVDASLVDTLIDLFDFKNGEEKVVTELIVDFDSLDDTLKTHLTQTLEPMISRGQMLKKTNNTN